MKITSSTKILDLAAARTGNRLGCDAVRVMTLSLVVAGSFLLQGCLAGAWVALVAVDTMQSSNVTVGSFEQSWVAQAAVRNRHVAFGAVAQSWGAKHDA